MSYNFFGIIEYRWPPLLPCDLHGPHKALYKIIFFSVRRFHWECKVHLRKSGSISAVKLAIGGLDA